MSESATILVVNAGSSSLKFALFDSHGPERIGGGVMNSEAIKLLKFGVS